MLLTQQLGVVPQFSRADRLRKAREITGLDQGQFASRAGFSRQTVSNYESGLYLRAWAEATGVDLHWLETGEAPADAEASHEDVRPKGLEPLTFWSVVMGELAWTDADDMAFQEYVGALT